MTTIESSEIERVETMIRRGRLKGRDVDFPFSLSLYSNITAVLGRSPLTWCLPGASALGDGLDFPTGEEILPEEQYAWPPRDPLKAMQQHYSRQKIGAPGEQYSMAPGEEAQQQQQHFSGFNSELKPSNSAKLRHRQAWKEDEDSEGDGEGVAPASRSEHYNLSPWHPDFTTGDNGDSSGSDPDAVFSESEPDEDEHGDGSSWDEAPAAAENVKSHVRRGSEGYEVRPKRYDVAYEHEQRLLEEQMLREYFDQQQPSETGSQRQEPVLLPSEIMQRRNMLNQGEMFED